MVQGLERNMEAMQTAWVSLVQPHPPLLLALSPPPQPTVAESALLSQPARFPYGMPQPSAFEVPLHLMRWLASPSLIPSWAFSFVAPPIYMMATSPTPSTPLPAPASGPFQLPLAPGCSKRRGRGPLLRGWPPWGVLVPRRWSFRRSTDQGAWGA